MMVYNPRLIEFFKEHNIYDQKIFNYLQDNSHMIDYNDPEQRDFVGCFYIINEKNILTKLILGVPYIDSEETMLISIHELTHGIEHYPKIGKRFVKDITIEALPLLYERIYINEKATPELLTIGDKIDKRINSQSGKEYQFALAIRDELLRNYQPDIQKNAKLVKRLSRKYR